MLLLFWRTPPATTGVTLVVGRPRAALVAARTAIGAADSHAVFRLATTPRRAAFSPLVILTISRSAPATRHGAAAPIVARARSAFLLITRATELQFASVIADVSDGGWTNELGSNVNLYASLDEALASDADYIQSSPSPLVADEVKLRFASMNAPTLTSDHLVRYRYQKDLALGDTIDLEVRLYRADGVTVIASRTHSDIALVTDATLALTEAEAGAISPSDYASGLIIGFKALVG